MNAAENDRIIVFDTETTGMNKDGAPHIGHRVVEIGCVEVVNRRLTGNHYHVYINPEMLVDPEAIAVHGITDEFLADKPKFAEVAEGFLDFVRGAQLVAHNASFDVSFIDHELGMLDPNLPKTEQMCQVTDTLAMAKKIFPGKRNNLDVLCERYGIDNSHRTLHGALLDAEILADVYLLMTGGQSSLQLMSGLADGSGSIQRIQKNDRAPLKVIRATADELEAHQDRLDLVEKKGGHCLWRESKETDTSA